jgi:hypothetical protein
MRFRVRLSGQRDASPQCPKIEVGVVTHVTIIEVNNPELKLKPGMTMLGHRRPP